jgi:hypothetical protein
MTMSAARAITHIEGGQERYVFTSVEQLIADFLADVRGMRGEL